MKKLKSLFYSLLVLLPIFTPLVSFAQAKPLNSCFYLVDDKGVAGILCKIADILSLLLPILVLIGVIYFVWGVIQYVIKDDEEAKKKGKDRIIFGILGFVVIFALWGFVYIVVHTFGLEQQGNSVYTNFIQQNQDILSSESASCLSDFSKIAEPGLGDILSYASCLINKSVIPLLFSVAMLLFIWGVIQYVINGDDEGKKSKGRDFMIWGIVGLTVMVGVWGLVSILAGTFGIEYAIPQIK